MSAPSFNAIDLDSVPGLIITKTNPYRFPSRNVNVVKIANSNKSVLNGADFADKKLNITVEIGRNNRALLEASLDKLYQILRGSDKALITPYAGTTRLWYATLSNVTDTNVFGGHGTYELEFECADPIGRDPNSTSIFSDNRTDAMDTTSFVLDGSAEWQQPIFTITYTALTGGVNKTVTLGNSNTGQSVSITRTFTAGDVLVIDPKTGKVTINGTEVPYTGAIPEWGVGPGSVDYSDNLTTRTRSRTAIYYKRYY